MNNIKFTPLSALTTERLVLRRLKPEDEYEIYRIRSDESIAKYLERTLYKSVEEACAFIKKINDGINNNIWVYWAVVPKEKDKLIGTVCLWQISEKENKADIGFELMPEYQGKGFMGEAVIPVINYGFDVMGLNTIEGEVDPANSKSIKLMKRNNFVLPAKGINDNPDTVIYKLTKQNRPG